MGARDCQEGWGRGFTGATCGGFSGEVFELPETREARATGHLNSSWLFLKRKKWPRKQC